MNRALALLGKTARARRRKRWNTPVPGQEGRPWPSAPGLAEHLTTPRPNGSGVHLTDIPRSAKPLGLGPLAENTHTENRFLSPPKNTVFSSVVWACFAALKTADSGMRQ